MRTIELLAYTHDGELCRFPDDGSWLRLEDCPKCGQTSEHSVDPIGDGRGRIVCDCGAEIMVR